MITYICTRFAVAEVKHVIIFKPLTSFHFQTFYLFLQGSEPPFTNFEDIYGIMWPNSKGDNLPECIPKNANGVYESDPEKYGTQLFKATLDYQWFNTNKLKCLRVLDVVDESVIQKLHALPNKIFPSDHLMIKASYSFI